MTGLFTHQTPHNQNISRVRSKNDRQTLIDFAEHLSEHGSVAHAAAQIGKSPDYGRVLLQRLRKAMGPQAI